VLNPLLNALVRSGFLEKDDERPAPAPPKATRSLLPTVQLAGSLSVIERF
jgi:hypothetical protein